MKTLLTEIAGRHNADLSLSRTRLLKGAGYRDCSTVVIIPTRGKVHIRVVMAWRNLMQPMNQRIYWLPVVGMEVGQAYTGAIDQVLANPELSKWPYILTLEEDNLPPPDGLMKLIESLETDKHLGAVGGLYWTKGEGGQPMIYGDPMDMPKSFRPQVPQVDAVQYCNGLGMGFTLFRTKMFKDQTIQRPLFRTVQEYTPGVGARAYTQDLYFFENAGKVGWRFACDTRVKVGHYDEASDVVW